MPEHPQPSGFKFNKLTFSQIMLNTRNVVVMTDTHNRIEWVNNSFYQITGYSLQEVAGQTPLEVLHGPKTNPATAQLMLDGITQQQGFDEEVLNYTSCGREIWFRAVCTPLLNDEGELMGFVAIHNNITARKEQEQQLRIAASVFDSSEDAVVITDKNNRIVDVNPAFSRITGYSRTEALGNNPSMLSSGKQPPEFYQQLWQTLQSRNRWSGELINRHKNGIEFVERLTITKVQLNTPDQWHYVATFSDITSHKNHAEELYKASYYDTLTSLPNQSFLIRLLNESIAHTDKQGSALAICHLNLDHFKTVNDRFGRVAGDQILATIAKRLKALASSDDILARVGSDEFVILLHEPNDVAVYQRILSSIEQPVTAGPALLHLSASMGITLYPADTSDPERLLRNASQAMVAAKSNGRSRYHFFDPSMEKSQQQRREQLSELALALERQEFVLHFQPQTDTVTGTVTGVEALIRWQHPKLGLLSPAAFLPAISGSDLEVPMGQWVISEALATQKSWLELGEQLGMSINISARHLMDPGFTDHLHQSLQSNPGLNPSQITLEVLESTALNDVQHAGNVLSECRKMGLQIALDDFGTGFSSLTYFRTLPIDLVKIDQTFILNILDDPNDQAIVESVIFMAKRFGRSTLAEGVETRRHAEMLAHMGCEQLQGYGIARPMPADELPDWLKQWRQLPNYK